MADYPPPRDSSLTEEGQSPIIDRLSATRRPRQWAVMRQNWRDLLFLHWAVPPEALRPLVPPRLELDLYDGSAYLGLVPFTMTGVRPTGLPPVWGLSSFHETNLRTYVRFNDSGPGVWFFNLEAASSIAVHLARALFHLPYHRGRLFLERERVPHQPTATLTTIVYAGVRLWPGPLPASYTIRATPTGQPQPRAAPAHSITFSSSDIFFTRSPRITSSRGAFTIRPILFNQQSFTHWMKHSWLPGASQNLKPRL